MKIEEILKTNWENAFYEILNGENFNEHFSFLGEKIIEKYKSSPPPKYVNFYLERISKERLKSFAIFSKEKDMLRKLLTYFLSGMQYNSLVKCFGEPILHDEFGEGFDEDEEKKIGNYSCATFAVKLNGVQCIINYDHRGTSIEVKNGGIKDSMRAIEGLIETYDER